MNKKFFWRIISVVRVWFQSFIAFDIALHIKDIIDGSYFWQTCLAAFIPVVLRWAAPNDEFPDEKAE